MFSYRLFLVRGVHLFRFNTISKSTQKLTFVLAPKTTTTTIISYQTEINYQALKDHCGIKAIIFDKDNTLTAPYENALHPRAQSGLQSALDTFGSKNVAILSNSAGTNDDPNFEDGAAIEKSLGIAVIKHTEKKPGGLQEVMNHFPNVDEPSQLCMVGDRLLTDVVFGNLHGMLTVHILPLCSGEENSKDNTVAKVIRAAENKFMYADWWGGRTTRSYTMKHKVWKGEDECPLVLAEKEGEIGKLGDEKDVL